MPVWGLAASYSLGVAIQTCVLFVLINRKLSDSLSKRMVPLMRIVICALISGLSMYLLVKTLDRSVWVKNIPFLGSLRFPQNTPFESYVLDTRYTVNVIFLTAFVALIGLLINILSAYVLKVPELDSFISYGKKFVSKGTSLFRIAKTTPIEPSSHDPMH
jgi:hypothetical protein